MKIGSAKNALGILLGSGDGREGKSGKQNFSAAYRKVLRAMAQHLGSPAKTVKRDEAVGEEHILPMKGGHGSAEGDAPDPSNASWKLNGVELQGSVEEENDPSATPWVVGQEDEGNDTSGELVATRSEEVENNAPTDSLAPGNAFGMTPPLDTKNSGEGRRSFGEDSKETKRMRIIRRAKGRGAEGEPSNIAWIQQPSKIRGAQQARSNEKLWRGDAQDLRVDEKTQGPGGEKAVSPEKTGRAAGAIGTREAFTGIVVRQHGGGFILSHEKDRSTESSVEGFRWRVSERDSDPRTRCDLQGKKGRSRESKVSGQSARRPTEPEGR